MNCNNIPERYFYNQYYYKKYLKLSEAEITKFYVLNMWVGYEITYRKKRYIILAVSLPNIVCTIYHTKEIWNYNKKYLYHAYKCEPFHFLIKNPRTGSMMWKSDISHIDISQPVLINNNFLRDSNYYGIIS